MWSGQTLRFFDLLTHHGLSVYDFLCVVLFLFPNIFLFVFPLGFFISVFSLYYRLLRSREIAVLQNFGLSLKGLAKPVGFSALGWCVMALIFSFWIIPWTFGQMKNLENSMRNHMEILGIPTRSFYTMQNMTFYVQNKMSPKIWLKVFAQDRRSPEHTTTLVAKKAIFRGKHLNSVYLDLYDGTLTKMPHNTQDSPLRMAFSTYQLTLPLPDPPLRAPRLAEYPFHRLLALGISHPTPLVWKEIHGRFFLPFFIISCGFLALIALLIPFSRWSKFYQGSLLFLAASLGQGFFLMTAKSSFMLYSMVILSYSLILLPGLWWLRRA